jgi:hypothetical protein
MLLTTSTIWRSRCTTRTLAALEKELTAAAGVEPDKAAAGAERAGGRLIHMAIAYLDFAAANTIRWRALFEHRQPEGKPTPDWYLWEQIRLFGYIEQPLRDLQPGMPTEQLAMLARSLFSAVHGIITLGLEKKTRRHSPGHPAHADDIGCVGDRNGSVGGDTMKKCGIVRPHKLSGMLKTHPDVSSKPGEHWVVGQFD